MTDRSCPEAESDRVVESPLTDPAAAPKQGAEGAPQAWLVFEPTVLEGLRRSSPAIE